MLHFNATDRVYILSFCFSFSLNVHVCAVQRFPGKGQCGLIFKDVCGLSNY